MPHATTPIVPPAAPPPSHDLAALRRKLLESFSARDDGGLAPEAERARTERQLVGEIASLGVSLPEAERGMLMKLVTDELFGYGPIQPLLDDATVTEIMVNRADRVYAERLGKPTRTDIVFDDDAHVRRIIDRIIRPLGRRLDADNPLVDARLPDGSRVNAVIPPVAIAGPCLTVRKFGKTRLGLEDLVRFGAMTPHVAEFLKACVLARLNIVVCGGTGSGKTTLLNCLSGCIPDDERIVTIEDAAELKLAQDHVITLESKRPNPDGSGEVTIRDLVRNALRMRPERIVVGECRGAETLDMLQAMNTGHDGSLTSLHANSPRDAISRIETMALMGGIDFPLRVIREQIGSAVQLVIHQSRQRDGSRRVMMVTEIVGLEGDKVVMQELFRYKEPPPALMATMAGVLQPSGLRPQFMPKIEAAGIKLNGAIFNPVDFAPLRRTGAAA